MNKEQALQVIKNLIDQSIKAGVCTNMESTAAIIQAWQLIVQGILNEEKK